MSEGMNMVKHVEGFSFDGLVLLKRLLLYLGRSAHICWICGMLLTKK